jgi:hypothetical protein
MGPICRHAAMEVETANGFQEAISRPRPLCQDQAQSKRPMGTANSKIILSAS